MLVSTIRENQDLKAQVAKLEKECAGMKEGAGKPLQGIYAHNDTLKISNVRKHGTLTVSKTLDGADGVRSLTDAEKKLITFAITDGNGRRVKDTSGYEIEPFTLADMGDSAAKSFDLPLGEYMVTETNGLTGYQLVSQVAVFSTTDQAGTTGTNGTGSATVKFEQDGGAATVAFTNRYAGPVSVSATKAWKNIDNTTAAPSGASVVFELFADGTTTDKKVTLDGTVDGDGEATAWVATFTGLDKYKTVEGTPARIDYTVRETTGWTGYTANNPDGVSSGGKITNTQDSTSITVQKVWSDAERLYQRHDHGGQRRL